MIQSVIEAQTGLVMDQLFSQGADGQSSALNTQVYVPGQHQENKEDTLRV